MAQLAKPICQLTINQYELNLDKFDGTYTKMTERNLETKTVIKMA